jgi:hypothetical protein
VRSCEFVVISIQTPCTSPNCGNSWGKDVEITVTEARPDQSPPDLSKLDEIAGKIDLDFDAIEKLREISKI